MADNKDKTVTIPAQETPPAAPVKAEVTAKDKTVTYHSDARNVALVPKNMKGNTCDLHDPETGVLVVQGATKYVQSDQDRLDAAAAQGRGESAPRWPLVGHWSE